jgi:hypothetical protein
MKWESPGSLCSGQAIASHIFATIAKSSWLYLMVLELDL